MRSLGLPAVFLVMLLKEAGIPIPVPGDVIMLGATARAATGQWNLAVVIAVFETAMIAGGTVQYCVARGPGRQLVYRLGRYIGLTTSRLDRAAGALKKGGTVTVAIGMATPGLRAAVLAASGVGGLPFRTVFPGLVMGDSVFFLLHVVIGYAGGAGIAAVVHGRSMSSSTLLLLVLSVLLLLGLAGWLRLRRRARPAGTDMPSVAEAAANWVDAACPVCLLLGAVRAES
jgi:membrane protein DedA with SNARE-associated domain